MNIFPYKYSPYAQAIIYSLAQCKIDKLLVKPLNFAHGGLDVEGLDVLPVLLQQGHQEVHGQVDVLSQFLLGHLNVSNGNIQAENLLHLELDGGLQVEHLRLDVIGVGDQAGELARLSRKRDQNLIDPHSGHDY